MFAIGKPVRGLIECLVTGGFGALLAFLIRADQNAVVIFVLLMSSCGIVFLVSNEIKTKSLARFVGMACAAAYSISFFSQT